MEKEDEIYFDTDLEDDDEADTTTDFKLPRISFDKKLLSHRSNCLNQTFGQINVPFQKPIETDDNTLIPIRCKTPHTKGSVQIYEDSCQILNAVSDWQLRELLPCDHITILNRSLSYNNIRAFSTAIESNLESLTLSSVGLTTRSIEILCQGLHKCVHLHLLDLSSNKLVKRSFEIIVDTLNKLTSLLYLSLADCGIKDSYGRCIGDVCRHERLTEINLSRNEFEEMACIFIGNALTENTSLIYLNISWNSIRSFASIALFRGFEMNKYLTEFDVSWSGLGYDGSVAIRRILAVNKILQRLNISNCNIDWTCSKLISEGLEKNSTLKILNLSFNPLTTHGVHQIIQALSTKKNGVSVLDISGLTVFSATVHLAETIAKRRDFIMKYDFEIPVHDIIGRQQVSKTDSMRKIIEHIDSRNWRTLDYFRLLENKKRLQLQNEISSQNIVKPNVVVYGDDTFENLQQRLTDRIVHPFTYKNLNDVIHQQRMRDRLQKARQEQQEINLKKRNQKILQTVNQHFPDIDIMSKKEKHKQAIEHLSKPKYTSYK